MNTFRRWHPVVLSTWLTLHLLGGLYMISRFSVANSAGMYRSFQEMYLRSRSFNEALSWLPDSFYAALIAGWLAVIFILYLSSRMLRKVVAIYSKDDHAFEALQWFFRSRLTLFLAALLLLMWSITLAFPIAVVPLLIASMATLGLSFSRPFLDDQRLPNNPESLWRATRGLLLFILLSTTFAVCLYVLSRLAPQTMLPIGHVVNLIWYVGQSTLEGLIVAASIFGLWELRHRASLRRFFSLRYLIAWVRLDYFGLLATLWLAPPLMISAVFMWFAYPTIKYQTQIDGTQISWWLGSFASVADMFTRHWYLATVPPVLALGTLFHAKIVIGLERSKQRT